MTVIKKYIAYPLSILPALVFFYQALHSKLKINMIILGVSALFFLLLCLLLWFKGGLKSRSIKAFSLFIGLTSLATAFFFYDLIPNIVTRQSIIPIGAQETAWAAIAPGDEISTGFSVDDRDFDYLQFYWDGETDTSENIHITLQNVDSGTVYADRFLSANSDIRISTERNEKSVFLIASEQSGHPSVFAKGSYTLSVQNCSADQTIQIKAVPNNDQSSIFIRPMVRNELAIFIAFIVYWLLMGYAFWIYVHQREKKLKTAAFFLYSVIPLAAAYLLLILPWSPPDAGAHYLISYKYSNGILGYSNDQEWLFRNNDASFYRQVWEKEKDPNTEGLFALLEDSAFRGIDTGMDGIQLSAEHMKSYSPLNYLPQIIGLTVGRLLGLGTTPCIYLARLLILLLYIVLSYHAVKTTPVGKIVLAAIALLPMSLMMSSSFSYDAMVILCALNFTASVFSYYKNGTSKRGLIGCAIWAAFLGAVKGGGYLLLLPLAWILYDRENKKASLQNIVIIILSGALSYVLFNHILISKHGLYQFGNGEGEMLSASFAFFHPIQYIFMALKAYVNAFDIVLANMGGYALGWMEEVIPITVVLGIMAVTFVYSTIEKDALPLQSRDKRVMWLVVLISFCLTPVMLLSWTPVGSPGVGGLQGRYYLPVLPLIILILSKFRLRNDGLTAERRISLRSSCFNCLTALNCLCVYYMMRMYLIR